MDREVVQVSEADGGRHASKTKEKQTSLVHLRLLPYVCDHIFSHIAQPSVVSGQGSDAIDCTAACRNRSSLCSSSSGSSSSGGGGGGGGGDFTDAALDTAGAEQRSAYEAAVVAHEEEEVRTVRSTVPRGVYIHRKVGEMEEME